MKFTRKDLICSVFTGFYTGFIAWQIFEFLKLDVFDKLRVNIIFHLFGLPNTHISSAWMMLIVPILWILGVNLGYFLGRWIHFFNQFGRFASIGFTNFIIYGGILNIFLWKTEINKGIWYSVFVSVAFIVSVMHSYGWNKYWVFSAEGGSASGGESKTSTASEFWKFLIVTGIAGLINVAIASFLVNFIHPLFGMSLDGWANIGGVAGSAVALMFSFAGLRLIVFKKDNVIS